MSATWPLLALCGQVWPLWAMSVTFINPGHRDEVYWHTASRAMQAAADDLGVQLQVSYAGRNLGQARQLVQGLVALPALQRPDYVILSNEFGTAAELLPMLDQAGIRSFLAFSGKGTGEAARVLGKPRQQYRHWLGSLEPRAEDAGYLTAQALIARFSGINTSPEALQLLTEGQFSTLAGGHFITGAWALVMLYDYDQGRDFASEGLEQERPLFTRFDAALAQRYLQRYRDADFGSVDFARHSKARNPALKRYDFSLLPLLPSAGSSGTGLPR